VIVCPECCAYNNDGAIYCSSCGIQLVSAPASAELAKRYDDLHRAVDDLSQRSGTLEERLRKSAEETRVLTEKLKAEGESRRAEMERQLTLRNRALEEQLQKASAEVKALATRVEASEQARRMETSRTAELAEANRNLLQQVRRLTGMRLQCHRCGGALVATASPDINLCPACGLAWFVAAQPYAPTVTQPSPELAAIMAEGAQEDYSHPGTLHAGRSWHGIFIHENCGFCGQQLQLTTDPNILYCPYCRRYQPHVHK